nr:uncharacterized protein LOC129440464 [Misgurnus anguillicaudatus]
MSWPSCPQHSSRFYLFYFSRTLDVQPPRDVKITLVGSRLQWKSSDDKSVLYYVQYKNNSDPADEWHNVSSYNGTSLKTFEITNEFYGGIFRVRAEKDSHTSEWQISKPVLCMNLNICIPLMTVNVKPGIIVLHMSHMDQSLKKEYGDHIAFNVSLWKVNGRHSEVEFIVTLDKTLSFRNLESGQKYCFQVQYSLYNKPYGNTSEQQCVNIPESPEEAEKRVVLTTIITTVLVLTICGCCIFALFKNHKKFKQILKPPVNIPIHFREFLNQEFPQRPFPSPSTESLPSCDVITLIENGNIEEIGQEIRS